MSSFLVGRLEIARLLEDRIEETRLNALEAVVVRTVLVNRAATVGVRLTGPGTTIAEMVATAVSELDGEIASVAEIDLASVTRIVDAIELMASRERRHRLRSW
jgi:hypothetical protein